MTTKVTQPPPPPAHTITVEPIGEEILALDSRYAHTSTLAVVERSTGRLVSVCATDDEPRVAQCGIEAIARSYAHGYGATFVPPAPIPDPADRVLAALAAAQFEGLSADSCVLAGVLAHRYPLPVAEVMNLVKTSSWDERVRVAKTLRDKLVSDARMAWLDDEYADCEAEVA